MLGIIYFLLRVSNEAKRIRSNKYRHILYRLGIDDTNPANVSNVSYIFSTSDMNMPFPIFHVFTT